MHWKAGLIGLLFIGTAAAQLDDIPDDLPDEDSLPGEDDIPELPSQDDINDTVEEILEPVPDAPSLPAYRLPDGSSQAAAPLEEYQHHIWSDGRHINDTPRDGYDLLDLRVWEVEHKADEQGLVLRLELVGNAITPSAAYLIQGQLHVNETNATPTVSMWTEDGHTWDSDVLVIQQNSSAAADIVEGAAPSARHHVVHLFAPYEHLNATIGQHLEHWSFEAWILADGGISSFAGVDPEVQPTDIAPGGFFVAAAEVPEPDGAGGFVKVSANADPAPSLRLLGPAQHIEIGGQWASGVATIRVDNPYMEQEQLVGLSAPEGIEAFDAMSAILEGDTSHEFRFSVPQKDEAYMVKWYVRTDIGGVAHVEVTVPAAPPPPPPGQPPAPPSDPVPVVRTDPVPPPLPEPASEEPAGGEQPAGEDSPAFALLATIAAIGAVLWVRRRA